MSFENTPVASLPFPRRKFLTALAAGAGSAMLSACGGGDEASAGSAVANAATSGDAADVAKANAATTTPIVNASTFGVKGDNKTNDRAALQKAIDATVGKILLISGKCRIDATGLTLRTNSHVRFAASSSIKLLAHNTSSYQIFRIWDVKNVVLEGAYLDGSKELNSAVKDTQGAAWGMGVSIAGSTNVTLTSVTTINCWGDGVYIQRSYMDGKTPSSSITVNYHHAGGCRRQGASIIGGRNITFNKPLWEDIGGTAPSAGLDFEPDGNADVLENIKIVSPTTKNCGIGILVYLAALPGTVAKKVTIDITQHRDEGAINAAFAIGDLATNGHSVTGHVASQSPTWVGSKYKPYTIQNYDRAGPAIEVTNPTIIK